jgi:hypothetical protein
MDPAGAERGEQGLTDVWRRDDCCREGEHNGYSAEDDLH